MTIDDDEFVEVTLRVSRRTLSEALGPGVEKSADANDEKFRWLLDPKLPIHPNAPKQLSKELEKLLAGIAHNYAGQDARLAARTAYNEETSMWVTYILFLGRVSDTFDRLESGYSFALRASEADDSIVGAHEVELARIRLEDFLSHAGPLAKKVAKNSKVARRMLGYYLDHNEGRKRSLHSAYVAACTCLDERDFYRRKQHAHEVKKWLDVDEKETAIADVLPLLLPWEVMQPLFEFEKKYDESKKQAAEEASWLAYRSAVFDNAELANLTDEERDAAIRPTHAHLLRLHRSLCNDIFAGRARHQFTVHSYALALVGRPHGLSMKYLESLFGDL